jgi:glucose-6-phosphate isomerase
VPLRQRPAWNALQEHYAKVRSLHLRQLFSEDPQRGERFTLEDIGLYFDYSKNRITGETKRLLLNLAEESGLRQHIDAMFAGDKINVTEQRAVLHVALRAPKGEQLFVNGADVVPEVHAVLDKMAEFVEQIRRGEWKGHTGKRAFSIARSDALGAGGRAFKSPRPDQWIQSRECPPMRTKARWFLESSYGCIKARRPQTHA